MMIKRVIEPLIILRIDLNKSFNTLKMIKNLK